MASPGQDSIETSAAVPRFSSHIAMRVVCACLVLCLIGIAYWSRNRFHNFMLNKSSPPIRVSQTHPSVEYSSRWAASLSKASVPRSTSSKME